MCAGVWPYALANWLTDRYFVMPLVTLARRMPMFRSCRMNETVSGVFAGVAPKAAAPGRWATLMPDATVSGVFGFGAEVAADAGPASAARGVMTAATPSTTAADIRVFLMRIMSLCTVLLSLLATVSCG